jgi:hypothetical protein
MTNMLSPAQIMGLATAALLAACSGPDGGPSGGSDQSAERQFDQASKEAARVLSISQTAAAAGNSAWNLAEGDDYARAVMCGEALGNLSERLEQSGMLDGQQLQLLERVAATFDRRATALATESRSRQSIVRDYEARVEADRRASADALLAMNCLQDWQASSGQLDPQPGA